MRRDGEEAGWLRASTALPRPPQPRRRSRRASEAPRNRGGRRAGWGARARAAAGRRPAARAPRSSRVSDPNGISCASSRGLQKGVLRQAGKNGRAARGGGGERRTPPRTSQQEFCLAVLGSRSQWLGRGWGGAAAGRGGAGARAAANKPSEAEERCHPYSVLWGGWIPLAGTSSSNYSIKNTSK